MRCQSLYSAVMVNTKLDYSVEQLIEDQENKKYKKENSTELLLKEFLTLRNESRLKEEISPKELNAYIDC